MIRLTPRIRARIIERFNRFTSDRPEGQCWIWQGAKFYNGYGAFTIHSNGEKLTTLAHRISAFIFFNFNLYENKSILHSCDNKPCINPQHLRPGTQSENIQEALSKGARFGRPFGFSQSNIDQIIQLLQTGTYFKDIASQFKCSVSLISLIAHKRGHYKKIEIPINYNLNRSRYKTWKNMEAFASSTGEK
jgi:hypothetical protein